MSLMYTNRLKQANISAHQGAQRGQTVRYVATRLPEIAYISQNATEYTEHYLHPYTNIVWGCSLFKKGQITHSADKT